MKPVLTKQDFVRRYLKGEFGNRAPTWNSLAEYQLGNYHGMVHIRNRVAGAPTWYNVPSNQVVSKWAEIVAAGTDPRYLYLSGMAPHDKGTIQGELQQSEEHLTLSYCSAQLPMRESIAKNGFRLVTGVTAAIFLKKFMDPESYDWVNTLLDNYPGHVIEFSCFSTPWGTLPNLNTIIWEIRNY